MRKLALAATAVAGMISINAAPAAAACTFPSLNLGSFIAGDRSASSFAVMSGGTVNVGGANRYHAAISGCAANARYRLTTGSAAPVQVRNGGKSLNLVPFVIAVNGTPLAVPVDLTRNNSLVLTGNPDLEVVLARTAESLTLAPGSYGGGYVMEFIDP